MRVCPYCKNKVRTVGAIRPNRWGDITGYVYCKTCNLKMHVYLDLEKDLVVDEVPKGYRKSLKDLQYEKACHEAVANKKAVLHLRQKKQEDTGIVIDISNLPQQNISLEELQKRLDSILGND